MLRDEIEEYKDCINQVHINNRTNLECNVDISQNGQLYLAQYHMIAESTMDHKDYSEFVNMMHKCEVPMDGGLFYRRHNVCHTDNFQSPDNIIGICASSVILEDEIIPYDIYYTGTHGQKYKLRDLLAEFPNTWYNKVVSFLLGWYSLKYVYKFDDSQTLKETWLGRQLGLVATIKFAAGESPTLLEKLVWCVAQIISANTKDVHNVDPINLGWMCARVAKGKSWVCTLVNRYFMYKVKKLYEGKNFGDYYWPSNPDHPNRKYFKWE